jgi:hypothetical protein
MATEVALRFSIRTEVRYSGIDSACRWVRVDARGACGRSQGGTTGRETIANSLQRNDVEFAKRLRRSTRMKTNPPLAGGLLTKYSGASGADSASAGSASGDSASDANAGGASSANADSANADDSKGASNRNGAPNSGGSASSGLRLYDHPGR